MASTTASMYDELQLVPEVTRGLYRGLREFQFYNLNGNSQAWTKNGLTFGMQFEIFLIIGLLLEFSLRHNIVQNR